MLALEASAGRLIQQIDLIWELQLKVEEEFKSHWYRWAGAVDGNFACAFQLFLSAALCLLDLGERESASTLFSYVPGTLVCCGCCVCYETSFGAG